MMSHNSTNNQWSSSSSNSSNGPWSVVAVGGSIRRRHSNTGMSIVRAFPFHCFNVVTTTLDTHFESEYILFIPGFVVRCPPSLFESLLPLHSTISENFFFDTHTHVCRFGATEYRLRYVQNDVIAGSWSWHRKVISHKS